MFDRIAPLVVGVPHRPANIGRAAGKLGCPPLCVSKGWLAQPRNTPDAGDNIGGQMLQAEIGTMEASGMF